MCVAVNIKIAKLMLKVWLIIGANDYLWTPLCNICLIAVISSGVALSMLTSASIS